MHIKVYAFIVFFCSSESVTQSVFLQVMGPRPR